MGNWSTRLHNDTPKRLVVYLEPWGECLEIAPGGEAFIQLESPLEGTADIDFQRASITIWAWSECLPQIEYEGNNIIPPEYPRCP